MHRNLVHFVRILAVLAGYAQRAAAGPERLEFNRDIRPILSENCFACHGMDKRKGNLRLDLRAATTAPAKSGEIAIVPGKPDASEMVRRVVSGDEQEHMPPAESKKTLTAAQMEMLRRWIGEGAVYQEHWAFVAPARPELPTARDEKWARTPIDLFVLAKLEAAGLKPAVEADKITLLRRLCLDLVGLPPTPAEVDAFVADRSPDAYEKQVERLLASPHYGERWGRHWLDAARYADSDGFEKDKPRQMSFYRDYVIDAFNRDRPYDRFIIEQLAGDQLPHPTQEQIVATGFLRNSMVNEEGGVDPEQFRMDAMFDRMDAIGKSVLGLTIQCAQCHSHKYDPLSQEEYYRMFAFLNNDYEAQRVVYSSNELKKVEDLTRQMGEVEAELRRGTPDWEQKMAAWEEQVSGDQPHWIVVPMEHIGDNDQRYIPQGDGSFLAQGDAPTKFDVAFTWTTKLPRITAFRLELLTDPNLPCGGPGRSFKGTCALTEFGVETAPASDPAKTTKVKFSNVTSDFDPPEMELEPNFFDKSKARRVTGPVKFAIDGDDKTAWGIDAGPARRNQDRKAVFECATPITTAATQPVDQPRGTIVTIHLRQMHGGWNGGDVMNNNLGRFRVSVMTAPGPVAADPVPKRVRDIFAIRPEKRTAAQLAEVFSNWRTTVPEWKEANERIEALWKRWPEGSTSLTLMARSEPRATHLLNRGDWLSPTAAVSAGVPAVLHPLPAGYEPARLTFAQWLVDRKSPTTARVFMNRMWQAYFGIGIVATSEDFGTQSESPSHPELLDWLACEFMDSGWKIKAMHRLIVNSATYRQSSRVTPEQYAGDPINRLLARGPRFRVEGEIVRDIALSASGLLNEKIGGRSVMPPAPAFLFVPPNSYTPFPWIDETTGEKYRRAIYTFRRRSTPYPALQAFDVPNADSSCTRRLRSNSPLQALVSLNEPIFVECARALARKALDEGGDTDGRRITFAFRRVLARMPRDEELKELTELLDSARKRFVAGKSNAKEMIGAGSSTQPATDEWAAYTIVARVLLNLDETMTKE